MQIRAIAPPVRPDEKLGLGSCLKVLNANDVFESKNNRGIL